MLNQLNQPIDASTCKELAKSVCSSPSALIQLIEMVENADDKVADRAVWCLSQAAEYCPEQIAIHLPRIIGWLNTPHEEAVLRNVFRMCRLLPVPEVLHGQLLQACFTVLEKDNIGSAPKAFALHLLNNFAKIYPDLLPEIRLIIEHRWSLERAAFHSAARKLLKEHRTA